MINQTIAVIPARGGSKRIPHKNIKYFCGKPIIAYSIEVALESNLFSRVIVSTDDEEIADVARRYGAEVPFVRPDELSDDKIGLNPVLHHALCWLQEQGDKIEYMCSIMATAPLLQPKILVEAYDAMIDAAASGATGVTSLPSCIFRGLLVNSAGFLEMVWPENFPKRSQDFPEVYNDAGQFSWFRVCNFILNANELPSKMIPVILPRNMVQDIDTLEDWDVAEQIYTLRSQKQRYTIED